MNDSSRFLVTGGNGYLASWIVKLLLDRGHEVRATVRSSPGDARYAHLHKLASDCGGRLSLHAAHLGKGDHFRPLVDGCDYVIHTASPFVIRGITDAENELVRPAIDGTRSLLEAVNRSASVRRVVMTSSVAAIYGDTADAREKDGQPFSEDDWNTSSSLQHQPYAYSKTLAERAAWEIAQKQRRWDLVTLNPGFMLGPSFSPAVTGVSQTIMRNFANGTYRSGIIDMWYGLVDVRDAAEAHIRACTAASAKGRYIISAHEASLWMIAQRLRQWFGDKYPLPRSKAPKLILWLLAPKFGFTRHYVARNIGIPLRLNNEKGVRELGMRYRPIDDTVREHFQSVAAPA